MGWGFRRSIKFGPVRLNLSKSGLGYSIGGKGLRVGRDAKGRSYRSASIPGTGIYSRKYAKGNDKESPAKKSGIGCLGALLLAGLVIAILSAVFGGSKPTPADAVAPQAQPAATTPPAQKTVKKHHGQKRARHLAVQQQTSAQ